MPIQASTDHDLARAGDKQRTTGSRILLAGGVLFALGLLLMLVQDAYLTAAGVALASLATPITIGGVALLGSGLVAGRAAQRKPFA